MTRVGKVAAVGMMTSAAVAAIAFGLSRPADAVEACPPLASATINAPTGTVAVGSTVHVSAQISGLMLFQTHLQVTGQGLNEQVGKSVMSGSISGNVTVPKAGTYTLAVIGNSTKCTYKSTDFEAADRATASPTHSSVPGKSPQAAATGGRSAGNGANPLAGGVGKGTSGNNLGLPSSGASPYSLPPVAPDGSAQDFTYPTPEPQVASPPAQPQARNVSETMPVKWGPSLAIALVLLVISAHLGMWSRRQRLAAEGAHSLSTGGRRGASRKRSPESTTTMAATATATEDVATAYPNAETVQPGIEMAQQSADTPRAESLPADADDGTAWTATGRSADAATEPIVKPEVDSSSDDASTPSSGTNTTSAEGRAKRSGGRGYRGRRRRN